MVAAVAWPSSSGPREQEAKREEERQEMIARSLERRARALGFANAAAWRVSQEAERKRERAAADARAQAAGYADAEAQWVAEEVSDLFGADDY